MRSTRATIPAGAVSTAPVVPDGVVGAVGGIGATVQPDAVRPALLQFHDDRLEGAVLAMGDVGGVSGLDGDGCHAKTLRSAEHL